MNKLKTIISPSGREYSVMYNPELDICIIMDCMTQESLDPVNDECHIKYNYVNYIHGCYSDIDQGMYNDYIKEYEKSFEVTKFDFTTGEQSVEHKSIVWDQS